MEKKCSRMALLFNNYFLINLNSLNYRENARFDWLIYNTPHFHFLWGNAQFAQNSNRVKISQNASKSTSITENRSLQNGLSKHWKQFDSKCQQEWIKFDPRVKWTFWTVQLLTKDPKTLVVFSVAMDITILFSCTSFWMFMAVTARDSDLSHVKLLERTSLQVLCRAVMSRAVCCSVKDFVRCGDQRLPLCGASVPLLYTSIQP